MTDLPSSPNVTSSNSTAGWMDSGRGELPLAIPFGVFLALSIFLCLVSCCFQRHIAGHVHSSEVNGEQSTQGGNKVAQERSRDEILGMLTGYTLEVREGDILQPQQDEATQTSGSTTRSCTDLEQGSPRVLNQDRERNRNLESTVNERRNTIEGPTTQSRSLFHQSTKHFMKRCSTAVSCGPSSKSKSKPTTFGTSSESKKRKSTINVPLPGVRLACRRSIVVPVGEETTDKEEERKPHPLSETHSVPSECAICLLDYEIGDRVTWSSNVRCNHAFHEECIVHWLTSHRGGETPGRRGVQHIRCPVCRSRFIDTDHAIEKEHEEPTQEQADSNGEEVDVGDDVEAHS